MNPISTTVQLTAACTLFLTACNKTEKTSSDNKEKLSEKTGIEVSVIKDAETVTHVSATRFKRKEKTMVIDNPVQHISHGSTTPGSIELPGVSFLVDGEHSFAIVDSLNHLLSDRACMAFISDDSYRSDKKQTVSVIHATDKYDIVRLQETSGGADSFYTDSLIDKLKLLERKYTFDFLAVGNDWMVLRPQRSIADWRDYANETLKVCPSDEEPEDLDAYANSLREEKGKLTLWWD